MALGSALQIGRSAVLAYQSAMELIGNNIANAGNSAYSRLSPNLAAVPIHGAGGVSIGAGVRLAGVQRNVSQAVEARLLSGRADRESARAQSDVLQRMEAIFNALGDDNLGSQIEKFFKSWGDLQNAPQDFATRSLVLSTGSQLAGAIRQTRSDLVSTHDEVNRQIDTLVGRVNQLTSQIADLNVQVVAAEAGGGSAGALRDQRDDLVRQLSELAGVTTRDQPGGAVNVYVGSEPVVLFGAARAVESVREQGANQLVDYTVRLVDNHARLTPSSGQLAGAIAGRNTDVGLQIARLDQLAAALIQEVNKVHASGQGLSGFSTLTGEVGASDATAALNAPAAGLVPAPRSGTFFIDVRDAATGTTVRRQITIDLDGVGSDTTLNSLAAQINASVPNLTATVQPDGKLKLDAASGYSFTFADDSTYALAALGLNTFFAGSDASDITLAAGVADAPQRLAASTSGLIGDGSNAGKLSAVLEATVTGLGGATMGDFYNASVGTHAVASAAANNALQATDAILSSLEAQRESVSGVNLDEEAIRMVTYQRAFEGAARYVNTVNEMLQTLLSIAS